METISPGAIHEQTSDLASLIRARRTDNDSFGDRRVLRHLHIRSLRDRPHLHLRLRHRLRRSLRRDGARLLDSLGRDFRCGADDGGGAHRGRGGDWHRGSRGRGGSGGGLADDAGGRRHADCDGRPCCLREGDLWGVCLRHPVDVRARRGIVRNGERHLRAVVEEAWRGRVRVVGWPEERCRILTLPGPCGAAERQSHSSESAELHRRHIRVSETKTVRKCRCDGGGEGKNWHGAVGVSYSVSGG